MSPLKNFLNCLGISGNAQAIEEMNIYKLVHNSVGVANGGQGVAPPVRENSGLN